jgi:hypothetical protein
MNWSISMKRIVPWLRHVVVRVIVTTSLLTIAFFFNPGLGYGNSWQSSVAAPLTPEATTYQVNSQDSSFRDNDQEKVNSLFQENKQPQTASETTKEIGENLSQPAKETKEKAEGIIDTIKEKLNLDQPLYPGTKEVLDDAANAVRGNQD